MIRRIIKRLPLEKSFAIGTVSLLVLVVGATLAIVHTQVHAVLKRGLADRGLAIAQSIGAVATPALLAYNYPALQVAADGAVEDPALVYVLIHDKEGEMASVATSSSSLPQFPQLPDLSAGSTTRDVVILDNKGLSRSALEALVPVYVEGVDEPWGTVRVGLRYDPVDAALRSLQAWLTATGLLLTILSALGGRWMARKITAPLRQLAEGTEALSKGDTSHRIPVSGAGELAELAQAFNRMMDRVEEKADESKAYEEQLAALNTTLEEQVFERTRALEESEAQYRTLVEHSPDTILIVQGGRVRFVNHAFEETFRIPQKTALDPGFRLESLFEKGSSEIVAERIRDWERGASTPSAEVLARDADGNQRELELRGSRIEYVGRPAAECLLVDTTESKRLRSRLEDTERLRALGELASGVAHDFNNLLGAILGRIQLLRARGFDSQADQEMAVIEKAARDGRETVRRIQDFSRTRVDRPFKPVSLPEILHDAVEITRTRWKADAERRNVKIDIDVDCEDVPPILGNATELREVFTNLILNAVDAMPQGGLVTLRCRGNDARVRAEVTDNGEGMTEEIRRHLFDPFYTTKGQGGTGLGMSVAYGIITRHDGTIEVSSTLGRGTTFTLEFPRCEASETAQTDAADAGEQPVRRSRILVIDDEQAIAQLLEDALSAEGHAVTIAGSGTEGVELAELSRYDLVLTDLGMPDMSGWEVARRIRSRFPETPVVLVTGWGMTVSREEVDRAGITAVVHKPFEITDMLATTREVLEHSYAPRLPEPALADGDSTRHRA